jgi:hypothetical protein
MKKKKMMMMMMTINDDNGYGKKVNPFFRILFSLCVCMVPILKVVSYFQCSLIQSMQKIL